jgi:hypothetical protein
MIWVKANRRYFCVHIFPRYLSNPIQTTDKADKHDQSSTKVWKVVIQVEGKTGPDWSYNASQAVEGIIESHRGALSLPGILGGQRDHSRVQQGVGEGEQTGGKQERLQRRRKVRTIYLRRSLFFLESDLRFPLRDFWEGALLPIGGSSGGLCIQAW